MDKSVARTGAPNIGGSIVTAGGLVFIGATKDSRFPAFEQRRRKGALGEPSAGGRPHAPMGADLVEANVL